MSRQRASETIKGVDDQLRGTRRAGGQQNPFGGLGASALQGLANWSRCGRKPSNRRLRFWRWRVIDEDKFRFRRCANVSELLGRQVGSAQNQSSRDPVEFHKRDGGWQLFMRREHYRSAAEQFQFPFEYRSCCKIAQRDGRGASVKGADNGLVGSRYRFPQRTHGRVRRDNRAVSVINRSPH